MKARVIATGDIVEVDECGKIFKDMGWDYMDMRGRCYKSEDLDFSDNTPFDYWTRFEHQYAGMAMQGILSNQDYCNLLIDKNTTGSFTEDISRCASDFAHALMEKYKKEADR